MRIANILLILTLLVSPTQSYAWGRDGHAVVGQIAVNSIDSETRDWLQQIIGNIEPQQIRFACNWPDIVREQAQYDHTRPYHYVNLPRSASSYQRERDCKNGDCVTERIKYFAARLGQDQLSQVERIKAFNWLCHLTGDLHQPLHAGFGDDRGGNTVIVKYKQTPLRLHQVWDTAIIRKHHPDWKSLVRKLTEPQLAGDQWGLFEVDEWTNASHSLVVKEVYPEQPNLSRQYEKQALDLIEKQLNLAGTRLARVLQAIRTNQVSSALPQ